MAHATRRRDGRDGCAGSRFELSCGRVPGMAEPVAVSPDPLCMARWYSSNLHICRKASNGFPGRRRDTRSRGAEPLRAGVEVDQRAGADLAQRRQSEAAWVSRVERCRSQRCCGRYRVAVARPSGGSRRGAQEHVIGPLPRRRDGAHNGHDDSKEHEPCRGRSLPMEIFREARDPCARSTFARRMAR
jgi:hypothetical protein